jgi:hypothetical protein
VTPKKEIREWFDLGVADGKSFMIVMCDTYDWDDYPKYYSNETDARRDAKYPGEMQKVMEIYDLAGERDTQLSKGRAFAFVI